MDCNFDKVITIKDDQGDMCAVIIHDIDQHSKKFYHVKEMGMDEILGLLNPNGKIIEMGKSHNKSMSKM